MGKKPKTSALDVEEVLGKSGLSTPLDALFVVPARIEDCRIPCAANQWKDAIGQRIYIEGVIARQAEQVEKPKRPSGPGGRGAPGKVLVVLRIDGGPVDCEEFGSLGSSAFRDMPPGTKVAAFAVPRIFDRRLVMTNPQFVEERYRGRSRPVYPRIKRCRGDAIASLVNAMWTKEALRAAAERVRASFPLHDEASVLALANRDAKFKNWFRSLPDLLQALHLPSGEEQAVMAARAASMISIGAAIQSARSAARREPDPRSVIDIPSDTMVALKVGLPFALSDEQVLAIRSLWASLRSIVPSEYILMGEVGAGKTVTYGLLAAGAQSVGKRVAIIIPNSVLQMQVASELKRMFPKATIAEVRADVKPTEAVLRKNPILVGTQAINTWAKKVGWEADLLIFDEQQKSSTAQRSAIMSPWTNRIEATATALPRSMGLCLYGQQSMAILSKPAAPKNIRTCLVHADKKRWLFDQIKRAVASGGKVAVILPSVVETEALEEEGSEDRRHRKVRAVESAWEMWEKNFPGRTVALHGQMTDEAKRSALERVCGDGSDICLASSIIEIGVNIPRLKVVVCVDPDVFGVSTLHQMRGRLVREGGNGLFVMYARNELKPESEKRLRLLEKHTSGVELAEQDMALRGFGDLGSESELQSGAALTLFHNVRVWPDDVRDAILWSSGADKQSILGSGDPRRNIQKALVPAR